MRLYGGLSLSEQAAIRAQSMERTLSYERFCEAHPYRVVGPEDLPERRFSTLVCAARSVVSEGPEFHVECGTFRAQYRECWTLVNDADLGFERGRAAEKLE